MESNTELLFRRGGTYAIVGVAQAKNDRLDRALRPDGPDLIFGGAGLAGVWLGGGSGAQGGSGQPPLPLELRGAVVAPERTGFRIGNGKVCVRTR